MTANEKLWLDQKELATLLGTTVKSINSLRYTGKLRDIPYVKWGNRYKYPKDKVLAWIEQQTTSNIGGAND